MSAPKAYQPYRIEQSWIVDARGNDVIVRVDLSPHYDEIHGERIMEILCEALNREESTQPDPLADHPQLF